MGTSPAMRGADHASLRISHDGSPIRRLWQCRPSRAKCIESRHTMSSDKNRGGSMPGQSSSRSIKVSRAAVDEAFKALSNWGRWGKDDQIGTLNNVTPADVVGAGQLIKRGKTFALGIPLGQSGPQRGLFGKRWNPIHTMLATGTDALAG